MHVRCAGMTRSVIPLLNSVGIRALSVGVNGASLPPDVPRYGIHLSRPTGDARQCTNRVVMCRNFIWRDEASGGELFVMYHPLGYGGIKVSDCHIIPGLPHAMCPVWKDDNAGTDEITLMTPLNLCQLQHPVAARVHLRVIGRMAYRPTYRGRGAAQLWCAAD